MTAVRHDRAARGFTLIELLIVIGILGVLAAVLLPRLLEGNTAAQETATDATMVQLEQAARKFERAHGYYPTDDLKYVEQGARASWRSDNGRNTGIESLVCMVSQGQKDGSDLSGLADHLVNTDADQHGAPLPLLNGRTDRVEVADAWGTPFAYFSKFGMDKPQSVVPGPDLPAVQVRAKRADGSAYAAKNYLLISAGKDLTFGTDDDRAWPAN